MCLLLDESPIFIFATLKETERDFVEQALSITYYEILLHSCERKSPLQRYCFVHTP